MALVKQASAGDEGAFSELVEGFRGELRAHCYRMLGSVHDAEDALQDALLRAWRGLSGFEGRSSPRKPSTSSLNAPSSPALACLTSAISSARVRPATLTGSR